MPISRVVLWKSPPPIGWHLPNMIQDRAEILPFVSSATPMTRSKQCLINLQKEQTRIGSSNSMRCPLEHTDSSMTNLAFSGFLSCGEFVLPFLYLHPCK